MTQQNDKGAVLLTTLLVMSIMAMVAVSIMDDVRFALKRTANIEAYAQADWYMQGAEDYAQSYLQSLLQTAQPAALNSGLMQAEPIVLPIEGGAITLRVMDGSTCISLGGLSENKGRKLFRQALETAGWDSLSAANFTSVAVDWVDADSQALPGGAEDYVYLGKSPAYRAANAPFASVQELRALSTMTQDKFNALSPFICARESAETKINVDTLDISQAPILAVIMGGLNHIPTAQQIITQRPPEGYQTIERLNVSPALSDAPLSPEQSAALVFTPAYLWVEASVTYRQITRHAVIEFELDNGQLNRIFKRLGKDARRTPMLKAES